MFGAEQAQVSGCYKCRNGAFSFFRRRRGTGGELLRLHNMQGISCEYLSASQEGLSCHWTLMLDVCVRMMVQTVLAAQVMVRQDGLVEF